MRCRVRYWVVNAVLAVLFGAAVGCDLPTSASQSLSFALGALFASQFQTTSVEYQCFRNGVQIDCSELPGAADNQTG